MAANERLARLLDLVPYLLARPGIAVDDVASEFAVSAATIRDDLQLLFVCGLPGYGPADLIDMSLDDDTVTITSHAGMSRPLRLAGDEAFALIVALRALADVPGLASAAAVRSAMAKVERASDAAQVEQARRVRVRTHAEPAVMRTISGALERGRALRLTYYSATRDAISDRTVDPIRLMLAEGGAYVEAWCRRAQGIRLFRLDRIDACVELAEPAVAPIHAYTELRSALPVVDAAASAGVVVRLSLAPAARWIVDYYSCQLIEERGQRWVVELRAASMAWALRLVMRLGGDARVLAPTQLAEEVAQHAADALARYGVTDRGAALA